MRHLFQFTSCLIQVKGQKGGYKFEKLPYNPFRNQQQKQPQEYNNQELQQEREQQQQQELQQNHNQSPISFNSTFMVSKLYVMKEI